MANVFSEIEDEIFFNEKIIFDENKIKEFIFSYLINRLDSKKDKEKPFYFEQIIYDFFDYFNIHLIKTKKTRDFGIDGLVKLKLEILGEIDLGLQIKYKLIDSNDVDLFLSALRNSELQLGIIVCKDSRRLEKYELNNKIKAILFSKGIILKEKLIKESIDVNPVFVLKLDEITSIIASNIRAAVKAIYKK